MFFSIVSFRVYNSQNDLVNCMSDISRVNRSHNACRTNYDHLSRWFDLLEGGWENRARQIGLCSLHITTGEKVLEIGCGTGHSLAEISQSASAIGLDLSFGMLSHTRDRLEKVHQAVKLIQGDALWLPFPASSFNVIFMAFTLELMDTPEIPTVVSEIWRVLKPGGRLGIVSLSMLGGIDAMRKLYELAHDLFPVSVDCRPIFARKFIEQPGITILDHSLTSQTGLGIEIVVGEIAKPVERRSHGFQREE